MAWETRKGRGRYYCRSKRVNGKVVREYFGKGWTALSVSALDELLRAKRAAASQSRREEKTELHELDAELRAISDAADLLAEAALLAAGFHQHHRGEWRRRRGRKDATS
jgi:hypothetical protein